MQIHEIQQHFSRIEHAIQQAAQACQSAVVVPMDLKDTIQLLEQRSMQMKKVLAQSRGEHRIRQCVNDLEKLGDRAEHACQQAPKLDNELKNAVTLAHQELCELKQRLH